MTFDMRDAREIAAKCQSRDESIDHDYWNAHAGMFLPTALDEIESQSISLDAAEALIRKNAETINGQAKQIATLKAALLEHELENIDPSLPSLEDAIEIATSQLAQEYPEIAWEETK